MAMSTSGGVDRMLSELTSRGLPRARARLFAAEKMVLAVGDVRLILSIRDEPLSGRREALLALDTAPVVSEPALLNEVRDAVRERDEKVSTLVLRLPPEVEPTDTFVGKRATQYIVAGPDVRTVTESGEWTLRPYGPENHDAVAALLREALELGYRTTVPDVPVPDVGEFVESLLNSDGVTVFTAYHRDTFAGHATVVTDEDELTGAPQLELFDQFVLREWRGTAAGGLLASAAVGRARSAGHALRGHVVGDDPHSEAVTARLLAAGWHRAESYWAVPLSGGADA